MVSVINSAGDVLVALILDSPLQGVSVEHLIVLKTGCTLRVEDWARAQMDEGRN